MKKHLIITLAAVLSICFIGCKANTETHEHLFGEWKVVKKATVDEEGSKEKACEICGYKTYESIPKIPADRTEITYDETDEHKIVTEYVNKIKTKETHYKEDDLINYIYEYDEDGVEVKKTIKYVYNSDNSLKINEYDSNGDEVKCTYYNSNGSLKYIQEYNSTSGIIEKITYYNLNGTVSYIEEYNSTSGIIEKTTYYNSNGSLHIIHECNSDGVCVKFTEYKEDGSVLIEYEAAEGNLIHEYYNGRTASITEYKISNCAELKTTYYYYNTDGSIDYIYIYVRDKTYGNRKYIKYNTDGTILIEHSISDGNYVDHVSTNYNGSLIIVTEYNSKTKKKSKVFDYKKDGTLLSINEYDSYGEVVIKSISYNITEGFVASIADYNSKGILVKETQYYSNGSIDYLDECDSNGKHIKFTKYNSDETLLFQYLPKDGNYFEITSRKGGYPTSFTEYDSNGKKVKYTEIDSDWTVTKEISS